MKLATALALLLSPALLADQMYFNWRNGTSGVWQTKTLTTVPNKVLGINVDGEPVFVDGGGGGTGSVTGPASSVDARLAMWSGTSGTVLADSGYTVAGILAAAAASASSLYQLTDQDLTRIAELSTTTYGRNLLVQADAAAVRTYIGAQASNANTSLLGQTIGLSELETIPQASLLGRSTSSTGVPEVITIGPQFSASGGVFALSTEYQEYDVRLDEFVDGAVSFQLDLDGGYTVGGPTVAPLPSMSGTTMDLTKYGETYAATADATLAFSGTPTTGQLYILNVAADNAGPHVITIPSSYSVNGAGNITSVTVPANGNVYLTFRREASRWVVFGDPAGTTGSGDYVLKTSPLIETPTISGAITFQDGVRQIFNPNGTNAGLNVGIHAGDPSSLTNGDLWYNLSTGKLMAAIGGSAVDIGSGGGGGGGLASTDIDTSAKIRGIVTDETGTGNLVFSASPTFTGTVTMDTLGVTTLAAGALEFEGSSADANETTLAVTNPTADRTWTIPDRSDTFAGLGSQTFTGNQTISVASTTPLSIQRSDGAADGTGQKLGILLGTGGGDGSGTILGHYSLTSGSSTYRQGFRFYDVGASIENSSGGKALDLNHSTGTAAFGTTAGSEQFYGKLYIGGSFATSGTNNVRTVLANPTMSLGSGFGAAIYDAVGTVTGSANTDHLISYQARSIYDSSGTVSKLTGFGSILVNDGGNATDMYGFLAYDPTGTGTVTNNYGLYVNSLTKGTNNYAIYTAGSTPSYFGGSITANGASLGAATATSPPANDNDTSVATTSYVQSEIAPLSTGSFGVTVDGGGSVLTSGSKGFAVVPFACTITGWSIVADASGSVSFGVEKATDGNIPTTSIVASAPPALSSAQILRSTTLTGWTTSVAANDVIEFLISGTPTTITRATLQIHYTR